MSSQTVAPSPAVYVLPTHPPAKKTGDNGITTDEKTREAAPQRRRSRRPPFAGPRPTFSVAIGLCAIVGLMCMNFVSFKPIAKSVVQKFSDAAPELRNATNTNADNVASTWNGIDFKISHIDGDHPGGDGDGSDGIDEDVNDESDDESDTEDNDNTDNGNENNDESETDVDAAEDNEKVDDAAVAEFWTSTKYNAAGSLPSKAHTASTRERVASAQLFLQTRERPESPACHPHFQHFQRRPPTTGGRSVGNNVGGGSREWSNTTKFTRLYFYHARKAGGTSLARYLKIVATNLGLKYIAREWAAAEEPGTYLNEEDDDGATFYVTHLREPIDRAISHFKYQGRWDCKKQLIAKGFVPSEDNALKLETWNQTSGHEPLKCKKKQVFFLHNCASNCYSQWFSGLSCPGSGAPSPREWYDVARANLHKYNMVIVLEKLTDEAYVKAIESFFGVPGVTKRKGAFCERSSHRANGAVPLVVQNDTLEGLRRSNEWDLKLYEEMGGCLRSPYHDFPKMDVERFASNSSIQMTYRRFDEWDKNQKAKKRNAKARKAKAQKDNSNSIR